MTFPGGALVILIAEDEPSIRRALELLLRSEHEVILCEDGAQALLELAKTPVDLVITDFQMPLISGLELIRRGKAISPSTAFILMTAYGSTHQAVEAIQLGADDYFNKPFDVSEMKHRIRKIEELRSYKIEKTLTTEEVAKRIIGDSPTIHLARKFVTAAATSTSPVLLQGPRGSGKEFIARAIHDSGPRAIYPFITLDCLGTDPQALEMEIFGYEKETPTTIGFPKPGKLELARGGTLFLDAVQALPPNVQQKLVPVLRDGVFSRMGSQRQIRCNARVIAASSSELKPLVDAQKFRDDLYYQVNILALDVPSLAERKEDLPGLIQFYWEKVKSEVRTGVKLAPEAVQCLAAYSFPGNFRELKNVLERLAVVGSDTGIITPDLLPAEVRASSETPVAHGLEDQVAELERRLILEALRAGRTPEKAAALLKLSPESLRKRLEKHGLTKEANATTTKVAA